MSDYIRKAIKGAFSTKQQSAYGTALSDTDITEAHPYEGNQIERSLEKFTDAELAGKGHEFPTYQRNRTANTSGSLSFDGSSYILGWVFSFINGNIMTNQPDDVNAPNTYQHENKMMNIDEPAIGKQLPVFTYVEQLADGVQNRYRDMLIKTLTITGKTGEQLKVQVELIGSGHYETSSLTMPDLVTTSFLRFSDIQLSYGGVNISADIKEITFKHINELSEKDGYFPGSGYLNSNPGAPQIRGRCLLIKRSVELSFKMLMKTDSTIEADSLANTIKAITVTAEGELIEDAYKHKLTIELPKVAIGEVKTSEDEGLFCLDCTCTVMWDSTLNAPYKSTIINTTPSYLVLPV